MFSNISKQIESAKRTAETVSKKLKTAYAKSAARLKKLNKNINTSLKKGKKVTDEYKNVIVQNEFLIYLLNKRLDKKEFIEIGKKNADAISKKFLEGCGGAKNIIKLKRNNYSITVFFRSYYRLEKSLLQECAGSGLFLDDHKLTVAFDWNEIKDIFKFLKASVEEAKSDLILMDKD